MHPLSGTCTAREIIFNSSAEKGAMRGSMLCLQVQQQQQLHPRLVGLESGTAKTLQPIHSAVQNQQQHEDCNQFTLLYKISNNMKTLQQIHSAVQN